MVLGAFVALLVPMTIDGVRDEYDRSHPAWVGDSVQIVRRDNGIVTLRIIGTKMRDCELVRVWAQTLYDDRPPQDAFVQRTGGRTLGYTRRPLGRQDLGELVVAPVPADAVGVIIHVQHDCAGRPVLSVLASAKLKE
jgi:hypothetical protein